MALELKISNNSISADGLTMTIKDVTGNYDAVLNPNGFGTPNPARNTLALFLLVNNLRYDGSDTAIETPLTIAAYDPLTVDTWSCTLVKQGWQQATVYGVQLYDTSLSFQVGEIVYDVSSSALWKILTASGSGPYSYTYEVVTTDALADDVNIKAYETILNTYAIPSLCDCLIDTNEYAIKTQEQADWDRYLKIDSYLKSIVNSFCTGSYTDAQLKVEQVEKLCTCFTSECNC